MNQNALKLDIPSIIPTQNDKEIVSTKDIIKTEESQGKDKKKKKENKKEKAPKIKNNDGKIHLQEEINPTTIALLNDKKGIF